MKTAFLYAGQGSQKVGMGADFYEKSEAFRSIFDNASVGFDLKETCFTDADGKLNDTRYTQPCMVAFASGVTKLLFDAGIRPDFVAGLSLGEYSALCAAGVFDPATAISLAEFRGNAMYQTAQGIDCAMIAVLNLSRELLQQCCQEASARGIVEIANYNCPGQLVIAGETAAVNRAAELAKEQKARCRALNTSGPFHTSLLAPAAKLLEEKFRTLTFADMQIPVLFNCLGGEKTQQDSIPALLQRQVCSSVYMEDIIRKLAESGVETIIEIGPGKVLSGFVRKTAPEIKTVSIDSFEDFQSLLDTREELKL